MVQRLRVYALNDDGLRFGAIVVIDDPPEDQDSPQPLRDKINEVIAAERVQRIRDQMNAAIAAVDEEPFADYQDIDSWRIETVEILEDDG